MLRSSPKESRPGHLPMPSPSSESGLFPSGEAPKEGVAAGGAFSRGPREATLVRFTARAYIVTLGPVLSYPEGTQPSAAGGDGAPTAMVAVPGLPGALTQGYPLLGGSGAVSMEASLANCHGRPRLLIVSCTT